MYVTADLRKPAYKDRDKVWCAVSKTRPAFLDVRLRAIPLPEEAEALPCVLLRRCTVQALRGMETRWQSSLSMQGKTGRGVIVPLKRWN